MLNLAILNVNHSASRSTVRLRDTAIARGHSVALYAATELSLGVAAGAAALFRRGEPLPPVSAVIPRLSAASDEFGLTVLQHFEAAGARALNVSGAITVSHDKLHTLALLAAHGVPVPPSAAVHRPSDLAHAIDLVGGAPIVVKTMRGSQGIGVMLAESAAAASAIAETLLANRLPVFVQRFFRESAGRDIRAFVVGGAVAAAMRRTAHPGEFRSNLHRGGAAEAVTLSAAEAQLAVRAAEIIGLAVAGVDIIETANGPHIIEVNSSPGLTGIEAATGVDAAGAIITHLESLAEGAPPHARHDSGHKFTR